MQISPANTKTRECYGVVGLLLVHTLLLTYLSFLYAPTVDEVAYLPAGISHWEEGHFELAKVNPPLARLVAAIPLLFIEKSTDWGRVDATKTVRSEHAVGRDFVASNRSETFHLFSIARLACIPFSLIAGYFIFLWSKEVFGQRSAFAALCLWCFSPNILGHGALLTPDVCGIAMGVASLYAFRRWMQNHTITSLILCGLWLGFAQLARTTWVVLYLVLPIVWFLCRKDKKSHEQSSTDSASFLGITFMFAMSLFVLNLGYGFQGTFATYDSYDFHSNTFSCKDSDSSFCLARILPGKFRIPLPMDYMYGVDNQKSQFEKGYMAFLDGHYQRGGFWYYYFYGLLVKLPTAVFILLGIALCVFCNSAYRASAIREEILLCIPIIAVSILVSAQTGINNHVRYIYPILPFLFIFISRIFIKRVDTNFSLQVAAAILVFLGAAESLWRYPDSISFFNIAAGGPSHGRFLLNHSNLDWGQDLLRLADWQKKNSEKKLNIIYFGSVSPEFVEFEGSFRQPYTNIYYFSNAPINVEDLKPGYYAISVQFLQFMQSQFQNPQSKFVKGESFYGLLLEQEPITHVGYSIYIYYLDASKISELRRSVQSLVP